MELDIDGRGKKDRVSCGLVSKTRPFRRSSRPRCDESHCRSVRRGGKAIRYQGLQAHSRDPSRFGKSCRGKETSDASSAATECRSEGSGPAGGSRVETSLSSGNMCPRSPEPVPTPGRDDPFGAVYRRTGQPGYAGLVPAFPRSWEHGDLRSGRPRRADPIDGFLPCQGQEYQDDGQALVRSV